MKKPLHTSHFTLHTSHFTLHGFTLIEVVIAVAILVVALVPLLKLLTDSIKAVQFFGDQSKADKLAQDFLEEIKGKRWDENSPLDGLSIDLANASNIGITLQEESQGEVVGNKLTFDDIDDYHNYTEKPPLDLNGNPLDKFTKFTRKVIIRYVTLPDTGGEMQTAGDGLGSVKTNYKWLKIKVSWQDDNKQREVAIESIRSNYRK